MRKIFGVLLLIVGTAWALVGLICGIVYFGDEVYYLDMTGIVLYLAVTLVLFGGVSGICFLLGICLLKKRKPKEPKTVRRKLEHFTSDGLEMRSYESAIVPKILCFFESWLIGSMAVLLAVLVIDKIGSCFISWNLFAVDKFWSYVWLAGFIIAVFRVAYWCNIRIEICRKGVIFYRANRAYKCYPIEAGYQLQVKRNFVNGIPTRSNMRMYIGLGKKDIRVEKCHCIGMDDFAAIQWDIEKMKRDGRFGRTERSDLMVNIMFGEKESMDFTIPKENMLREERKRLIQIICACFGVGVILLVLWFNLMTKQETIAYVFVMSAIVCFFPCIVVSVIQVVRYVTYQKRLPSRISLTSGYLSIEGERYFWANMRYVVMTNVDGKIRSDIASGRRKLAIYQGDSKVFYLIGNVPGVRAKAAYAEYEELVRAIKRCCEQRQISFREL